MQNFDGLIQIRPAAMADVPRLCELLSLLFAQEADFKPNVENQSRGLRLILEVPEAGRIYCATSEASVVGMVSILFTVSTAEGGRAAWLEDMVVDPAWRSRGVGVCLVREAVKQAQAAGCRRITLLTDADNSRAMHFYGRAGFVRSQMVPLRLRL